MPLSKDTLQLLSAEGTVVEGEAHDRYWPLIQSLDEDTLRLMYSTMAITRALDHEAGTLQRQGQMALWVVPALAVAGLVTLHQLTGGLIAALETRYGQFFALKLSLFGVVMGLAAYHRFLLTPALERGQAQAGVRLRRSLRFEGALMVAILIVTATLTHLTGPGSGSG